MVEKVIHTKNRKNVENGDLIKLSTLSTPKVGKTGDYSGIEKNERFVDLL